MLKIGFLGSCKMGTVGVRSPGHRDTYFKFSETLMVIMILVLKDDDDVHREG